MYLILATKSEQKDAQQIASAMRMLGAHAEVYSSTFKFIRAARGNQTSQLHFFGSSLALTVLAVRSIFPGKLTSWTMERPLKTKLETFTARSVHQLYSGTASVRNHLTKLDIPSALQLDSVALKHSSVSALLLELRGLRVYDYVLVEKGARASMVHFDLPMYRLTGRETGQELETLYGGARAVVVKGTAKTALEYGAVPVMKEAKKVFKEIAHVELGTTLPPMSELMAMGYQNRSIVTDYLSSMVVAKKLLTQSHLQQFYGEVIPEYSVLEG